MPRTQWTTPEAESTFNDHDVKARAVTRLADDMKVDNYTNGTMSTARGSEAQSIAEQVRNRK